jgi:ribonucleoside-diphosphate reductase alpha chain
VSCAGLNDDVKPDPIVAETMRNLYDGVPIDEVYKAAIMACPHAHRKRARLHLRHGALVAAHHTPRSAGRRSRSRAKWVTRYAEYFPKFIQKGVDNELLDAAQTV